MPLCRDFVASPGYLNREPTNPVNWLNYATVIGSVHGARGRIARCRDRHELDALRHRSSRVSAPDRSNQRSTSTTLTSFSRPRRTHGSSSATYSRKKSSLTPRATAASSGRNASLGTVATGLTSTRAEVRFTGRPHARGSRYREHLD